MRAPIVFAATLLAWAASGAAPLADPWLPPAARAQAAPAPETRGAALQAQVLAKLQQQFQRADTAHRGAVSLAEAQAAGWGFAVQNFGKLDASGHGEIRTEDLQRFVQTQSQRSSIPDRGQ